MKAARVGEVLAVLVLLSSTAAFGQVVDDGTRNAARSLAGQAKDAFERRDYENARDLFHRAYTLVPAPTIAVFEARALVKLGRLVEAEEGYMRAVRTSLDAESPEAFRKAVREAEKELGLLQVRVPNVTIVATGPGAQGQGLSIALDGVELKSALLGVATPIDPGEHKLTATPSHGSPVVVAFSIAEKQQKRVEIDIPLATAESPVPVAGTASKLPAPMAIAQSGEQADKPARSWQRPAAMISAGVGVAGVATGVIAGLVASGKYSKAEAACPHRMCVDGSAGWDAVQSFRSLRTLSTVGYVVGGVGLAAGVTFFLTAPSARSQSSPSARLWVGSDGVAVKGAF